MLFKSKKHHLLAIPTVLILGACDNPVEPGEAHFDEIESVEITDMAGNLIAEMHGDHWHFAGGGSALHLHPGDEKAVRIFFIAEDGDRFQLPDAGAEHTLRVTIEHPTVVEYEGEADHGHFVALTAGDTTADIQVFHGDHPDWDRAAALPIEVVDHGAH